MTEAESDRMARLWQARIYADKLHAQGRLREPLERRAIASVASGRTYMLR